MSNTSSAVITSADYKILSVVDTVKKYSPELSDADIQAFVWYNRSLGIPMTGWEKWFIGKNVKNIVTANEDVDYLNQLHEKIGKFQKGDEVGKVTKFEMQYNGITYVAIRKFDNSLCLVDKSKLNIDTDKIETSTEELDSLVRSKSLLYLKGSYLPLHVYSNTDYDTLNTQLEVDKEYIIGHYGQEVYDYHKSIINSHSRMMVNHPIKDKRFKLNTFGEIARNTNWVDADGYESSITDQFLRYTRTLKASDFVLVSKDVFFDRIHRGNYKITRSAGRTEDEKLAAEEKSKQELSNSILECDRLFSEFLNNIIDSSTQSILNKKINETYNKSILVNTSKIPVGFVCNAKFKNAQFELKPVQVEAFKFAVSRNNFCLALTVGFGKTSSAIAVLSYLITTGTIKKPLIIVPKPVLKNWQKELFGYYENGKTFSFTAVKGWKFMSGILTGCGFDFVAINNLSKPFIKRAEIVAEKEKCIILGSYEALQKMYIGSEMERFFVINLWKDILEQTFEDKKDTERTEAKKISSLIEKLNKVDKDAQIDIQSLGLDSIFFDEAHRLKNLFSGVAADKTNGIHSGFKGTPSDRALRAFYITQYFQKVNGRIAFLTATPFSNTPLEVYTMLVFLNFQELVKNNVHRIVNFVELFFNETLEYKVNQNNKIVSESVMKSYKNKPILYKILTNTFLYKDDPKKANIQRPCIIRYPNTDMKLMLQQSPLQLLQRDALTGVRKDYEEFLATYPDIQPYFDQFSDQLESISDTKSALGQSGKIMSSSRSSAVSPFAQSPMMLSFVTEEPWRELYEYSPKIKFTIDTIREINSFEQKNEMKQGSFLIFMGLGVNLLDHFKIALNKICNFKTGISISLEEDDDGEEGNSIRFDEVEIISGTADTDKEANRRERISDLFNKGLVKVIIGTDTIKEGLNLQVNCATEFILTPTWNSTDIKQIEGRIHRQGNRYGYARIITPLVSRTLDSFIYQKYEEKQSRINDIWSDDGISTTESMDVEIKPEKQKELILDDAKEIALIRADMLQRQEINGYNKLKDELDGLTKALSKADKFKFFTGYFSERLPMMLQVATENRTNLINIIEAIENGKIDVIPAIRSKKDRMKQVVEYYDDLLEKINHAISTNQNVDLSNIFNGNFKRRQYYINMSWENQDFIKFCEALNIKNGQRLIENDIFSTIGITTGTKYYGDTNESIYEFSAIYAECSNAEKYILQPEGVSLSSSSEALEGILNKYQSALQDKLLAIQSNFEVEDNKYYGLSIKAKESFIEQLKSSARIELDAENKLAKYGDKLAKYFTESTNKQLTYALSDVDLDKCEVPIEAIDIQKIKNDTFILDEIPSDSNQYARLFEAIEQVIPQLRNLKTGYYEKRKDKTNSIEPLSIEAQQLFKDFNLLGKRGIKLIMEQNYTLNGDLMTDPRIDFAIYGKERLAVPLNFENNGMGYYIDIVENAKIVNLKKMKDTINYCIDSWIPTLKMIKSEEDVAPTDQSDMPKDIPNYRDNPNTISDHFFKEHPDKVLGEFSISGYMNKIIVKGSKAEVEEYFDKICPVCQHDKNIQKGIKEEKEHLQVAEDLYNHVIQPEEAPERIAEDHLKDNPNYYDDSDISYIQSQIDILNELLSDSIFTDAEKEYFKLKIELYKELI